MEKLYLKDKKILYQLDIDSRQSYRSIGRKVGLSKDVISSRIKKFQDTGIIKDFITVYDYLRLGLTALRFYFKFQYITPEIKKEIINYFEKSEFTTVVGLLEGNYDLLVLIVVKNVIDIYPFWQKTLDKYGDFFAEIVYSNYVGESIYRKSFLINSTDDRLNNILIRSEKRVDYDNVDFQLLKILTHNSRIPTINIVEKLKITAKTISNRINRLIKTGLILQFGVNLDWNKLGYQWFKVDFFLKEYNKKYNIIKYLEKNPNLAFVDHTIGYADLELEFFLKDFNHLYKIIEDVSSKFPKDIRNYKYFHVLEQKKEFVLDIKKI